MVLKAKTRAATTVMRSRLRSDDGRARRRRADAAAEHVGEAAALPAVEQHEEDEQQRVERVDEADPEDQLGEDHRGKHDGVEGTGYGAAT